MLLLVLLFGVGRGWEVAAEGAEDGPEEGKAGCLVRLFVRRLVGKEGRMLAVRRRRGRRSVGLIHVTSDRLTSTSATMVVWRLLKESSSFEGMRTADSVTIMAQMHILPPGPAKPPPRLSVNAINLVPKSPASPPEAAHSQDPGHEGGYHADLGPELEAQLAQLEQREHQDQGIEDQVADGCTI